jgi:hypothetical protein
MVRHPECEKAVHRGGIGPKLEHRIALKAADVLRAEGFE